jgi:hypothetical protein
MERREFVEKLGVGSAVALVTGGVLASASLSGAAAPVASPKGHQHHAPVKGPLAAATVAFGAWRTDLSLDRFPNVSAGAANAHGVAPYLVTVKVGGMVAFVISGLHQVIVYGPDIAPESINASLTRPSTGTPAGALLINDPANRVYSGLDPSTQPRERTEVVQFSSVGKFLVICGVQSHFVNDQMYGWVRVLPADYDE